MTTGQFIKEQRLKKGMTQEELASKTDLSARTIQRIENGEVDPRAYTLQNIASALELDFEVLNRFNFPVTPETQSRENAIWLPILHLSGLLFLLIPPLVIWFLKKDEVNDIRQHAVDVINFQLSMLFYMIACGILSFLVIPVFILPCLFIFGSGVILVNTIKVFNGQRYSYPIALSILKY